MMPSYGPATIEMFGSLYPEGEVIKTGKVDTLGDSPNATAKLYIYEPDVNGGHFREVDRITEATIKVNGQLIEMTGTSDQMVYEVGVPRDEAQVRWVLMLKKCTTCN